MKPAINTADTNLCSLSAHVDITPPGCDLFTRPGESERCPDVVLINPKASAAQMLGFAYIRCNELAMLANMASSGNASEAELRQCTQHLWNGLETLLTVLHSLHSRMGESA